jgi:hypothetical protein
MYMESCSVLDDMSRRFGMVRSMRLLWCSVNVVSCGGDEPAAQLKMDLWAISLRQSQ